MSEKEEFDMAREQGGQDQFPPETYRWHSWSSIRFIRAPSSEFLMWSIVTIAITCIAVFVISSLVEMDVTVRGPGQIVTDFGSRDALSQSGGQITEVRKNTGDKVQENEVIALIKLNPAIQKQVADLIVSLQNFEKRIRFYQESNVFDFTMDDLPATPKIESGPALDAVINLEQQVKLFEDIRTRSKKGLNNELKPLRQRAALLESKIRKIKSSNQQQLLGQILESTEEEVGRIRSQISSAENEAKLKIEQGMGELLRSAQAASSSLQNYLDQREVRSPITGVIGDISVKVNESIDQNKLVAKILPENSQMMAAVYIYSKDIVKVAVDKPTLFKIDAYPYQTYGSFTGKVISFEQTKDNAAALGDYVVYSTVEFPPHLTDELRSKMRLIVGMKLSGDIVVERKSGSSILKKMVFEKN